MVSYCQVRPTMTVTMHFTWLVMMMCRYRLDLVV